MLPEVEAVNLIEHVGTALEKVHAAKLIHRDIKPDNIMLCDDGRVVLIDFGLIKQDPTQDLGTRRLTRSGIFLTEGFAPPEQYERGDQFGPFSDIYALGATLYCLLTGQVPTPANYRKSSNLLLPNQINSNISQSISNAVMQALEMDSYRRPQTVRAFLAALKSNPAPVTTPAVSTSSTSAKSVVKPSPPAPSNPQQLSQARARAQMNINQWLDAVAAVREAEQHAQLRPHSRFQVPIGWRLSALKTRPLNRGRKLLRSGHGRWSTKCGREQTRYQRFQKM
jgi:serine/threonine protein kinase